MSNVEGKHGIKRESSLSSMSSSKSKSESEQKEEKSKNTEKKSSQKSPKKSSKKLSVKSESLRSQIGEVRKREIQPSIDSDSSDSSDSLKPKIVPIIKTESLALGSPGKRPRTSKFRKYKK